MKVLSEMIFLADLYMNTKERNFNYQQLAQHYIQFLIWEHISQSMYHIRELITWSPNELQLHKVFPLICRINGIVPN